eukprot:gnl/MRDRNA2_/MRDRNA2_76774_c0_seq1.p1 gnl/MRDRNA2_/MRDRNA2_76774_c0~~gnl/MRDRNA2_/MRDRNA2_76774_c0_seq1.p1  ORF type:complete len:261 (+),score=38.32 gnl/MRDRNA2_/MRDRNA2_76774_c0_seq1:341-1123(+)
MPTPLMDCTAAMLNGDLYVVGGSAGDQNEVTQLACFKPSERKWAVLPPMPTPRRGCAAGVIDGSLYVVGGYGNGETLCVAERYDPRAKKWFALPPMLTARSHCAAAVFDKRLYVFGGEGMHQGMLSGNLSAVECFDPVLGIWTALPEMPTPRSGCVAGALRGRLHVAAGYNNMYVSGALEIFDPVKGTWDRSLNDLPTSRENCAAAVVAGRLWVVGGWGFGLPLRASPSTESFDPDAGVWDPAPSMPTVRASCAAVAFKF